MYISTLYGIHVYIYIMCTKMYLGSTSTPSYIWKENLLKLYTLKNTVIWGVSEKLI